MASASSELPKSTALDIEAAPTGGPGLGVFLEPPWAADNMLDAKIARIGWCIKSRPRRRRSFTHHPRAGHFFVQDIEAWGRFRKSYARLSYLTVYKLRTVAETRRNRSRFVRNRRVPVCGCRARYVGLGLAQLQAQIRLELEDFRPDP